MKKVITAITATLIVGFFTASAYACGGCGYGNGGGMYGNGYNQSGYNNGASQSFYNDTQALRSSIAADRAELNAIMAGANPDSKRARTLSEQISKSENEMRLKAQQNNISGMGMMGYGQGWSCGITGHNHNFAGCW
ncbi:MAG: zinc resistance protein [Proteobacteria bacterium]|nr:zinc resistance protein [Pseudomonadota bacterium]MBU1543734.1 zinc resistance protein [Pseudomonadota bacterium]MBU2482985.1 zinc resistance protein [Pseudomonadota bacterium]